MANDKENIIKFNRPGTFVPAFSRASFLNGAPIKKYRLADFNDTNLISTASFRYDPPGMGMKSTQQLKVDWSNFQNHIFFNSAEVATNIAFDKIINAFPFDGSRSELESFYDSLTGFEKWVYDQFPKYNGYLYFSGSTGPTPGTYIEVVDHAGSQFPTLSKTKTGKSALDPELNSLTIELQLYVPPITNDNQVIVQKLAGTNDGFTLGLVASGSTSDADITFTMGSGLTTMSVTGTISKGAFRHVAAIYDRDPNVNKLFLYVDNVLLMSSSYADLETIDFTLRPCTIGSGTITQTTTGSFVPTSTFSGALDDLRIFHSARTPEQLKKYATKSVFAQPDLKLYFKFNEPPAQVATAADDPINRMVLDHSGLSLHAYINEDGYSIALRQSGSLINPMINERLANSPILFPSYAPIATLNSELLTSASNYDNVNANLITKLIPKHYFLEGQSYESLDTENGEISNAYGGDGIPGQGELGTTQLLSAFLYIFAQQFDDIKLFIDAFGKSLFVDYDEFDVAPDQILPFVASYYGFKLPTLFASSNYEQFINAEDLTRDPSTGDISLQTVQNQIWRRILANMSDIIRSKGTLHSIKSFIRCLGIDPDQNFRIREYGGSRKKTLTASRQVKTQVSTLLDTDGSNSFTIRSPYLTSTRLEPGWPYIDNSANDSLLTSGSWTMEMITKFPLERTYPVSQSLVRMNVTGSDFITGPATLFNVLITSASTPVSSSIALYGQPNSGLTNTLFMQLTGVNMFDGEQWNVAWGRIRNDDPAYNLISNKSQYFLRAYRQSHGNLYEEHVTSSYYADALAVNALQNIDANVNSLGTFFTFGSQSLSNIDYLTDSSELLTDFDGKLGHIRFWSKGLDLSETREHARNFKSVGVLNPLVNFNFVNELTGSFERLRIDASTDQIITDSNIDGNITIFDFSQNNYHLIGSNFIPSSQIIKPEIFRYSMISPKFDESITDNKIRIRSFQDANLAAQYDTEVAPIFETPRSEQANDDPRFAMDISVIDSLNEDIINIFATLDILDNMIGEPPALFSSEYQQLEILRDIYFQRLTDKINFKGLFEFFKWFDSSIGMFIEQLIPRKTSFLGVGFVVESHMLERPKYQYQYEDAYIGELNRHRSKEDILVKLVTGQMKRY